MGTYNGTSGNDSINGSGVSDTIRGVGGNDTLYGAGGNDSIDGGAGTDTIRLRGNFADYEITWNSTTRQYRVVDRVNGRDGTDLVTGVESFRFADGTRNLADLGLASGDGWVLTGTTAAETLMGGVGYDLLTGLAGNDVLDGRDANDTLDGGDGNDRLIGWTGNDSLIGGAGTDIATFRGARSEYTVSFDWATRQYTVADTVVGRDGVDVVSGVENFSFAGGVYTGNQLVPGTGEGVNLAGTANGDALTGSAGYDSLQGLAGNDTLTGLASRDTLDGGDGQDFLIGGMDDDRLLGGAGMDVARFTGVSSEYSIAWDALAGVLVVTDSVAGRDGTDTLVDVERLGFLDGGFETSWYQPWDGTDLVRDGTPISEQLQGRDGFDVLRGLAGDDVLSGGGAEDTLDGGEGSDTLIGGTGNDVLIGGAGGTDIAVFSGSQSQYVVHWDDVARQLVVTDRFVGRDGMDRLDGFEAYQFSDGLYAFAHFPQADGTVASGSGAGDGMYGSWNSDHLSGLEGNDGLFGREADDTLEGGVGDDYLEGGMGDDWIEGDAGMDAARFMGASSEYEVEWDIGSGVYTVRDTVAGRDGTDHVRDVESFLFADGARTAGSLVPGSDQVLKLVGGASADVILAGHPGHNHLQGLAGADTLVGGQSDDLLQGGIGNDVLVGDGGNDVLEGGGGDDTAQFWGSFSDYTIRWNTAAYEYVVSRTAGSRMETDRVRGVETFQFADRSVNASDLVPGAAQSLVIVGSSDRDMLFGGTGHDFIEGGRGGDTLNGLLGDDVLAGGDGHDSLAGDEGNDVIDGGEGDDSVRFNGWSHDYTIAWDAAARHYTVAHNFGWDGVDVVRNVERFEFTDGFRDWSNLVQGAGDGVVLAGTPWSDWLYGSIGYDRIDGGEGNDLLVGLESDDTLTGGDGDDTLEGGSGRNHIDGGAGMDGARFNGAFHDFTISWDSAARQYTVANQWTGEGTVVRNVESFGFDDGLRDWSNLVAGAGDGVVLTGTEGDDTLVGSAGHDSISGEAGHDTIDGGAANDTLSGGDGDDRLMGGGGDDTIDGGAGTGDHVQFTGSSWEYSITWDAVARAYTVAHNAFDGDGTDVVRGVERFAFNDGMRDWSNLVPGAGDGLVVTGTAGDDMLMGSAGYDELQGAEGNDHLDGGGANDTLAGGEGDDALRGGAGNDQVDGGAGIDRVDFNGYSYEYTITWDAASRTYTAIHNSSGGYYPGYGMPGDGTDVIRNVEMFSFYDGMRDWSNLVPGAGDGVVVTGTAGDDMLMGSAGYDELQGAEGNDHLDGGGANDTLAGGEGDDALRGGAGNDQVDGGAGIDRVDFNGYSYEYTITWDAASRTYTAVHNSSGGYYPGYGMPGDGTDVIRNVEMFSFYDGMRDWSNLVPGAGDGLLVTGTAGDDMLMGSAGYDELQGAEGNDHLDGGGANDTLAGGEGDDALRGGAGNDQVDGGAGIDRVDFNGYSYEYTITWDAASRTYTAIHNSSGGYYPGYGMPGDGTDVIRNVEMFSFYDGMRDWSNLVPGAGDGVVVTGTAGDDMLMGSAGYDELQGAEGNDHLDGGGANDTLAGGEGDDALRGGAGNDQVDGGAGIDRVDFNGYSYEYTITWDAASRTYTAIHNSSGGYYPGYGMPGDGTDVIRNVEMFSFYDGMRDWSNLVPGAGDGVVVTGTAGDDMLMGSAGYDELQGAEGNDHLDGGGANDTLAGGDGDDALRGGAGNDQVDGGAGIDRVDFNGYSYEYTITWDAASRTYTAIHNSSGGYYPGYGMPGDGTDVIRNVEMFSFYDGMRDWSNLVPGAGDGLVVTGTAGDDMLMGSAGYDELQGGDGSDALWGGAADDVLNGGAGLDYLDGGAGSDTFVFDRADAASSDFVAGFLTGQDRIALDQEVFTGLQEGVLAEAAFQLGSGSQAYGADTRIVFDFNSGALYYDADGAGGVESVQFATLNPGSYGPTMLMAADLYVS